MIDCIAAVIQLPPEFLFSMFALWMFIVGTSAVVYRDARRHHIGPISGLSVVNPGALAALILWIPAVALLVYMWRRKAMIERATKYPFDESGLTSYLLWL